MARKLNDAELCDKLNANAPLRERIESLLLAVEDESGDLREANAAEMRIIDEMRRLGRESLTAWAQGQVVKTSAEVRQAGAVRQEGKKNCAGTPPLEI